MFEPGSSFEKFVDIESLTSSSCTQNEASSQEEIFGTQVRRCDSIYLSIYANRLSLSPLQHNKISSSGSGKREYAKHQDVVLETSSWLPLVLVTERQPRPERRSANAVCGNTENAANCIKQSLQLFFFFYPVGRISWRLFSFEGQLPAFQLCG